VIYTITLAVIKEILEEILMSLMEEYLHKAISDMDVTIEKRNDGGYIVVANKLKHLPKGKNVFTYWPRMNSIAVIILGLLPNKTYYSVDEMEREQVAAKIKSKYTQLIG